jgi:hypothetical protein
MSAFSTASPRFEAFLATAKDALALGPSNGRTDARNTRFVPRNFLIDERIDAGRAASYAAALPPAEPISFSRWNESHNAYLDGRVFKKPPATHDYHSVSMDDPAVCPETFRAPLALTAFEGTDLDTNFIRIVPVPDLAWLSGRNEDEIYALGEHVARDQNPAESAWSDLAMILDEAFHGPRCDHRPVFASFYEDFMGELHDAAGTDWPDLLRDRLGLYHLVSQRVFLFRYQVRELPRRHGEVDRRPIALPAVLDHRLAEAFCPAPRELRQGQLLNLQANATVDPAREVLHLFMPLEPKHLIRVGRVTSPVPPYLGPARRDHLLWMRLLSEREEYAATTDSDLFSS